MFRIFLLKGVACKLYQERIRIAGFVVHLFSPSLSFYAKLSAAEDAARANANTGQAPAI